jgi:glycosyltransferase involved in cell wall biosynthesis
MNIAFVWDWTPNFEQTITWKDGLAAALKELEHRGHTVTRYADTDIVIPNEYGTIHPINIDDIRGADVILHWADMTRPHALPMTNLGKPMAICFAGGEVLGENVGLFDHIFVESEVYKRVLEEKGYPVSIAFGTNTDLFKPVNQPKVFDTIFPATFAAWKRHDLYAKATKGLKSLACGYMYDTHEQECWKVCLANGVAVLPHVSADVLHRLYAASRVCVIPSMSSGGSQRTVLEALAMNIPVIVTDSDKFDWAHLTRVEPDITKIRESIDFWLRHERGIDTRDYVLENWSHIQYADALETGLKKIV